MAKIDSKQGIFRLSFGIIIAVCVLLSKNNLLLQIFLALAFTISYFVFELRNNSSTKKTSELQILFYFLSFIVLVLLTGHGNKWIADSTFIILGIASGVTNLVSFKFYKVTNKKFNLFKNNFNSLIYLFSIFIILILFFYINKSDLEYLEITSACVILLSFYLSIILTVIPIIITKEIESLVSPLLFSSFIYVFSLTLNYTTIINFSLGFCFAFIVAFISSKFKLLTLKGSMAQFILAVFIFGFGGLKWTIPILAFFILSSILSKFRKRINSDVDAYFEKSEVRDHYQVLANGGLGAVLVIINQIFPSELLFFIYVSSLAAVCADTWATEIGTLRKTKTINILSLKFVNQGQSGGVSINGMIGAILGAFIIAISSLSWISKNFINFIILVTTSGVLGSIIDSILGASLQAQFKCKVCGKITERKNHCDQQSIHYKGLIWFDNDIVNFITSIAGGIFFIPLKSLFKV